MSLAGKTLFISGASRGIGLAIGLRAARDGANVAIVAKTVHEHPKLPGTIYTAAEAIERAGGAALPLACDIRSEEHVREAVEATVSKFGGIDICINNASAISLTRTLATEMKRYDLMQAINTRGTYVCSRATLPYLKKADNPHILTLSPPLDLQPKWFAPHVAYSIAKYGMSLCTLGMAEEFKSDGVAVNSLWPLTTIDTAAVRNLLGGDGMAKSSRTPEIMADAAYIILTRSSRECTGNFFIDEQVLHAEGVTDLTKYAAGPADGPYFADFFVPEAAFARTETPLLRH
jgi:citronellol/citronellal dehydrogenase